MSAQDHLNPHQFFHGTRAELRPGDLIEPGYTKANYSGFKGKRLPHVYMTDNQVEAQGYARDARGSGIQRVYSVEPTAGHAADPSRAGEFMSDEPLRVLHEAWHDSSWGD